MLRMILLVLKRQQPLGVGGLYSYDTTEEIGEWFELIPEEKSAVVALDMLVYDEILIWNQYSGNVESQNKPPATFWYHCRNILNLWQLIRGSIALFKVNFAHLHYDKI